MSALKYWLWLTELPGLTNQTRLALLQHFPTPEDVYYAEAEEVLLTEGITREQAILLENKNCAAADRILADCQRLNVNILTLQDAGYPNRLRNIYDPPCLLYVRGRLPAFDDEAAVAVVGTRDCTPYGVSCAEKLGHGLAAGGAGVGSGVARGIDSAALREITDRMQVTLPEDALEHGFVDGLRSDDKPKDKYPRLPDNQSPNTS